MDELMRWLGKQLDRDREIAAAAKRQIGDDWDIGDEPYGFILSDGDTVAYYEEAGGGTAMSRAAAVHAAEHDPARVLREIAAKRHILKMADDASQQAESRDYLVNGPAKMMLVCLKPVLLHLATAYADRPGYREEWRP